MFIRQFELHLNSNKEQKLWLEKSPSKYNRNPQDMKLNEQYIPGHRLLGWIMSWDPKWVAGPLQVGLHMTRKVCMI